MALFAQPRLATTATSMFVEEGASLRSLRFCFQLLARQARNTTPCLQPHILPQSMGECRPGGSAWYLLCKLQGLFQSEDMKLANCSVGISIPDFKIDSKLCRKQHQLVRLPRCSSGMAASLPTTPLILREALSGTHVLTGTARGRLKSHARITVVREGLRHWTRWITRPPSWRHPQEHGSFSAADSQASNVKPKMVTNGCLATKTLPTPRYSPSRIEDTYAGLDLACKAASGYLEAAS